DVTTLSTGVAFWATQRAPGARLTNHSTVGIQARESARAARRAAAGAVGASALAAGVVPFAGNVTGWSQTRKLANRSRRAAAVAVGARARARVSLAVDVAGRAPALEDTVTIIAAGATSVGADTAAVVVVAQTGDVARWLGAAEMARGDTLMTYTLAAVATIVVIIAAASVQG